MELPSTSMLTGAANTEEADRFCGDVLNAVLDYCDDGIDAFQSCLADAPALDEETLQCISKGLDRLHADLTGRVQSSMALFEQLCKSVVLYVPPVVILQQGEGSGKSTEQELREQADAAAAQQAELDCALSQLRAQLQEEVASCQQLMQESSQLDAQLQAYGDTAAYQAVGAAAVAAGGGQLVLQDLTAISAAKAQLVPLLARAAALQATQPVGTAQKVRMSSRALLGGDLWLPSMAPSPLSGSLDNLPPQHLLLLP